MEGILLCSLTFIYDERRFQNLKNDNNGRVELQNPKKYPLIVSFDWLGVEDLNYSFDLIY